MAQAYKAVQPADEASETWLSALMDGEMDDDEATWAIGRLSKDADAMRTWSEYGLIGDAMRGCVPDTASLEQRIKSALAAEPTILAPMTKASRQPVYWAAAAAAVVAITWTVLSVAPGNPAVPVAVNGPMVVPQSTQAATVQPASAEDVASNDVAPYMEAHQDYAFTVAGDPGMHITPVSLSGAGR
ncbi:MAG: sigma-E factor negative regulatory protein [Parasulfuritortus sp.]|jgi:sigma-E factor negative regulatory protein RseA|nr:sigma-E factor negative regulatory protein [Parasulfuritortus sp.]